MRAFAFVLFCAACAAPVRAADDARPKFPLQVSLNQRYLMDQDDKPFLYHADTAWMILFKLTPDEATDYLKARRAQRFNAIQIMLTGIPELATRDNLRPFGGQDFGDFAQPNEAFFKHADRFVARADEMGMLLAMVPLWVSCCRDGWGFTRKDNSPGFIQLNGPKKCFEYGRFLGKRYARSNNIIWVLGGDNDPHKDEEALRQLALGIKKEAPHHLITYHASSSHSSTDVWLDEEWLDVSMTYTYFRGFNKAWNKNQPDVYEQSYLEYNKPASVRKAFFLGESTYEGEHGDWGSPLQARKNAYWSLLAGGCGHAYGSPNWNFPKNWREVIDSPGARSLGHFQRIMSLRPWWTLVPDQFHKLALSGMGEKGSNNYATTAIGDNGSLVMTYFPSPRQIEYDLNRLSGREARIWWMNAESGKVSDGGTTPTNERKKLQPPGDAGDWLLILENTAKGYEKP